MKRRMRMSKRRRGVGDLRDMIFMTMMRIMATMTMTRTMGNMKMTGEIMRGTCSLLESNWAHTNSVSSSSSGDWRELACPALSL